MIVSGSMNYSPSGRKRKVKRASKKERPFIPITKKLEHPFMPLEASKPKPKTKLKPFTSPEDTSYRKQVSSKYTVSIPYNKGAYQVIPSQDIDKIGK